jgi:hypothetical protein
MSPLSDVVASPSPLASGVAYASRRLSGEIRSPRPGARLPGRFVVSGRLSSRPPSGQHVWLASSIEGVGLFPKGSQIKTRQWRIRTFEGAKRFSLVLIVVNAKDHQKIRVWFARGRRKGTFPPLEIARKRQLDEVVGLAAMVR